MSEKKSKIYNKCPICDTKLKKIDEEGIYYHCDKCGEHWYREDLLYQEETKIWDYFEKYK